MGKPNKKYRKKYSNLAKLLKLARQVEEISMVVRELDEDAESNAEDYADEFIEINERLDSMEYVIYEIISVLEKEGFISFNDDTDDEEDDDDDEKPDA